jgi:hypothetical protein
MGGKQQNMKQLKKNCLVCSTEFTKPPCCSMKRWLSVRNFCSISCSKQGNTFRRDKKHPNIWNRGKKGLQVAWNKGNGEYAKELGFGKWMLGKKQSVETKTKKSFAAKERVAAGVHNFYIDGRTPINKALRNSYQYRLWREAVFARDNWTCQGEECGKRGCELNADHIKPWAYFPELRFAIDNGRTLCVPCHEKTPTYKGKANNFKRV